MAQTETHEAAGFGPFEFVDALYEQTAGQGEPIGFNLFDVQLCKWLGLPWLLQQADTCGVTEQELGQLVESGVIRTWADRDGNRGFLLYTPEQVKTFKRLRDLGHYSDEELRHIIATWDADIECTLEVLPYDDSGISEFENYRRRIADHIDETKQQLRWRSEHPWIFVESPQYADRLSADLQDYERLARRLELWASAALTSAMQDHVGRNLFRLRWIDEWIRIGNANKYQAAIDQGFGPEVFFGGYSSNGSIEFTFGTIDWKVTLDALQRRISGGKHFPLRTPDFDLAETGIVLHGRPTPEAYAKIYERYQFAEMQTIAENMGSALWNPLGPPRDGATCAGCGSSFQRTVRARQYCSEKCRSRAKQRRYRERDPERARLVQARYWKTYAEDFEPEDL
jgi:hypothetical protein